MLLLNCKPLPTYVDYTCTGGHDSVIAVCICYSAAEKQPSFYESVRDGVRKRIYDCPAPGHHFHLQYCLLPGGDVAKTDVVTFDLVSKVFTECEARVVRCWEEAGLNHFGWRERLALVVWLHCLILYIYVTINTFGISIPAVLFTVCRIYFCSQSEKKLM